MYPILAVTSCGSSCCERIRGGLEDLVEVLSGVDSVRKRPGMYVGSVGPAGLVHLAFEIVSNSLDEVVSGHATRIDVDVRDGVLEVSDDGRGFPFGLLTTDGRRFDQLVLTELHTTATADGHAPHLHMHALHGVGLAVVSALCESMTVEAVRDGVHWRAQCSRGRLEVLERVGDASWQGTRVRIRPDAEIFDVVHWPLHLIRPKLVDVAHLIRGLTISLGPETFCAPNGLADRMRLLGGAQRQPVFHFTQREDGFVLEVAALGLAYARRGYRPDALCSIDSWCNGGRTVEHGSHVDGALAAFARHAWWPKALYVSVIFDDVEYAGPTKGFLRVPALRQRVMDALDADLAAFVDEYVEERR